MTPETAPPPSLLTISDVATTLALSRRSVYRLIAIGELKAIRVTPRRMRIQPADLAAFLTQPTRAA